MIGVTVVLGSRSGATSLTIVVDDGNQTVVTIWVE